VVCTGSDRCFAVGFWWQRQLYLAVKQHIVSSC